MIKFFIRTNGKRVLDESYSQIEYEILLDPNNDPIGSLIEQFNYISQYDAVLLEDDLILCNDFKNKVEEVVQKYPDRIISFFTVTGEPKITESDKFHWSQARYYPKGITNKIAEKLEPYRGKFKTAHYVTLACKELGYNLIEYRPCLVQHLDLDTYVYNIVGTKRSPLFIEYLNELNFTLDEVDEDKFKQLIELMNEKFDIIKKARNS